MGFIDENWFVSVSTAEILEPCQKAPNAHSTVDDNSTLQACDDTQKVKITNNDNAFLQNRTENIQANECKYKNPYQHASEDLIRETDNHSQNNLNLHQCSHQTKNDTVNTKGLIMLNAPSTSVKKSALNDSSPIVNNILKKKELPSHLSSQILIWSPITQEEQPRSSCTVFPVFQTPLIHPYTPSHISQTLGIQIYDKDMSWNSGMETPVSECCKKQENDTLQNNKSRDCSPQPRSLCIPRNLFSTELSFENEELCKIDKDFEDSVLLSGCEILDVSDLNALKENFNEHKSPKASSLMSIVTSSPFSEEKLLGTGISQNIICVLQDFVSTQQLINHVSLKLEEELPLRRNKCTCSFTMSHKQDKSEVSFQISDFSHNATLHRTLSFLFASQPQQSLVSNKEKNEVVYNICSEKKESKNLNNQNDYLKKDIYIRNSVINILNSDTTRIEQLKCIAFEVFNNMHCDFLTLNKQLFQKEQFYMDCEESTLTGNKYEKIFPISTNRHLNSYSKENESETAKKLKDYNNEVIDKCTKSNDIENDTNQLSSDLCEDNTVFHHDYAEEKTCIDMNSKINNVVIDQNVEIFLGKNSQVSNKQSCSNQKTSEENHNKISLPLDTEFQHIDLELDKSEWNELSRGLVSFKSASGKSINISGHSLQQVKLMWEKTKNDPWTSSSYHSIKNSQIESYSDAGPLRNGEHYSELSCANVENIQESELTYNVSIASKEKFDAKPNSKEIIPEDSLKVSTLENMPVKSYNKLHNNPKTSNILNNEFMHESPINCFIDFSLTQVLEAAESTYICLKEMEGGEFTQTEFNFKSIEKDINQERKSSLHISEDLWNSSLECLTEVETLHNLYLVNQINHELKSTSTENDKPPDKSKSVCNNIINETQEKGEENTIENDNEITVPKFQSFTTASGKKLHISEAAWEKSEQLFCDLNANIEMEGDSSYMKNIKTTSDEINIADFTSLSSNLKEIHVDDGLLKSQDINDKPHQTLINDNPNSLTLHYSEKFNLKNASECNMLDISEKLLEDINWESQNFSSLFDFLKMQVQNVEPDTEFSEKDMDPILTENLKQEMDLIKNEKVPIFHTANGERIEISEMAVKTVEKLLSQRESPLEKEIEVLRASQNENSSMCNLEEPLDYVPTFDMSDFTACCQSEVKDCSSDEENLYISNESCHEENENNNDRTSKDCENASVEHNSDEHYVFTEIDNETEVMFNTYIRNNCEDQNKIDICQHICDIDYEEDSLNIEDETTDNILKKRDNENITDDVNNIYPNKIEQTKEENFNQIFSTNSLFEENIGSRNIDSCANKENIEKVELSTDKIKSISTNVSEMPLPENVSNEHTVIIFSPEENVKNIISDKENITKEILFNDQTEFGSMYNIVSEYSDTKNNDVEFCDSVAVKLSCLNVSNEDEEMCDENNNAECCVSAVDKFSTFTIDNDNQIINSEHELENDKQVLNKNRDVEDNNISAVNKCDDSNVSRNENQEIDNTLRNDGNENDNTGVSDTTKFPGFSTAGGNKIYISEHALKKAKNMLSENNDLECISSETKFPGFSTAGGNKIHVSEHALKEAKNMLNENSDLECISSEIKFPGFNTAGGNKIHISEDALKKAKKVFSENSDLECISSETKFPGCNTAGGNKIHISEHALKNAKNTKSENNDLECISSETKFPGFSTAGGDKIHVSEHALKEAKNMLNENSDLECISSEIKFPGFNTAGGNKIHISEDTLKKAKKIFSENSDLEWISSETKFPGCNTAGGNKIHISADALKKAKKVFSENSDLECISSESRFHGFSTESGNKIHISEDALKKAKNIVKENSDLECVSSESRFPGFSTAGGNKIHISEDALKKAKNIVKENSDLECVSSESRFPGFSTAGGNKIHISEDALKKAKNTVKENSDLECVSSESRFPGFSTAGGNKIHISEDALKKAKNIVKENSDLECVSSESRFPGFNTAGGNKIHISEDALKKAKNMLSENSDLECISSSETKFPGFNTAGGNKIHISEDALKKAKNIVKENSDLECVSSESRFLGFSTAGGNKIHISEDALKKAKNMLSENSDLECISSETKFPSFNTAGGNKIHISEDALKKAKNIVKENSDLECVSSESRFPGFSTAGGNKIHISECALKKAKKVFNQNNDLECILSESKFSELNIANEKVNTKEVQNESNVLCNNSFAKFSGFVTANGNKVVVSEETLDKAKETNDVECNTNAVKFSGFSTANRNRVAISEEALKKAKEMLDESSDATEFPDFNTSSKNTVVISEQASKTTEETLDDSNDMRWFVSFATKFPGFNTTNENKTDISEQTIKEAKEVMNESNGAQYYDLSAANFPGLLTGNRNKVVVSEQVLKKIKLVLDNSNNQACYPTFETNASSGSDVVFEQSLEQGKQIFDNSNSNEKKFTTVATKFPNLNAASGAKNIFEGSADKGCAAVATEFSGFSTAGGGKVSISDQALGKVKNIFNEINEVRCISSLPQFSTLDTASENKVVISEKALREVKEMLAEIIINSSQQIENDNSHLNQISEKSKQLFQESNDKSKSDFTDWTKDFLNFQRKNNFAVGNDSLCTLKNDKYSDVIFDPSDQKNNNRKDHSNIFPKLLTSTENIENYKRLLSADSVFVPPFKKSKLHNNKVKEHPSEKRKQDGIHFPRQKRFRMDISDTLKDKKECQENQVENIKNLEEVSSQLVNELPTVKNNITLAIEQKRKYARKGQEERIAVKAKVGILPGKLWNVKSKCDHQNLKKIVRGSLPGTSTREEVIASGIRPSIVDVNFSTAKKFIFEAEEYFSSEICNNSVEIKLADDMVVILNEKNEITIEEICRSFLDGPGVDPNLINRDWIHNHYSWIVWKLAAMERSFPHIFGRTCLTPENILLQLKYRYDREIDQNHRSALKKIMERDDTSTKTMILCVADIKVMEKTDEKDGSIGNPIFSVLLTDGWYKILANTDSAFQSLIRKEKIFVGQKLIITGAELTGFDSACSPLEAPPELMLKISTNSLRRACWNAKLGYFKCPKPFPITFSSLYPTGGLIGCVDCIVQRVYQLLFMEKYPEGNIVFHNERMESKAAAAYEKLRDCQLEKLLVSVQKEFETLQLEKENQMIRKNRKFHKINYSDIEKLTSGEEIYKAVEISSSDAGIIETVLNKEQRKLFFEYKSEIDNKQQLELQELMREKINEALQENKLVQERVSIPIMKVLLVGVSEEDRQRKPAACMLTVWRPSEKSFQLLTEGKLLRIFRLMPGSMRNWKQQIQLNTTKMTDYEERSDSEIFESCYLPRKVTKLADANREAAFNEIDVVGVVVLITHLSTIEHGVMQVAYLCDEDFTFLAVKFLKGLSNLGVEEILVPGNLLAISSLSNKYKDRNKIYTVTATELSSFTSCPKSALLKDALNHLQVSIKDINAFVNQAQEYLKAIQYQQAASPFSLYHIPQRSASPFAKFNNDLSPGTYGRLQTVPSKRKLYPVYSPLCLKSPACAERKQNGNADLISVNLNLKGEHSPLDTPKSTETRARIFHLSKFGSAPPLPLLTSPASTSTKRPFMSPIMKQDTPLAPKSRGRRQWRGKTRVMSK